MGGIDDLGGFDGVDGGLGGVEWWRMVASNGGNWGL